MRLESGMTRQTKHIPATPMPGSFWGIDDASLTRAESACRSWLDAGEQIQRQAIEYVSGRFAKDCAMLGNIAKCGNTIEIMNLQSGYAREAFDDFIENGRRIATLVEGAVSKGFSSGSQ
jgi:hypothetical protein